MMKETFFLLLVIAAPLILEGRFQLWNNIGFQKELSKKIAFSTAITSRFREHPFRVYYYDAELDLFFKIKNNWEFGLGHQIIYQKNDMNAWLSDPSPLISLQKTWKLERFTISNRSRGEYSFHDEEWSYRNRTSLLAKFSKPAPYISQEFFFTKEGYTQNRLYLGLSDTFAEKFRLELAYLWLMRKSQNDRWASTNVIHWNLKYNF